MNPGELRDQITLQQPSMAVREDGQAVNTWSDYKTALANVKTPSKNDFRANSEVVHEGYQTKRQNEWLVKVRYDSSISSDMRVVWLDHVFDNIIGITADLQNAEHMWLHCRETVVSRTGFGEVEPSPGLRVYIGMTDYEDGDTYHIGTIPDGDTWQTLIHIKNDGETSLSINTSLVINLLSGNSNWTSGSGSEYYYADTSDITEKPQNVFINGNQVPEETVGSLSQEGWGWDSSNGRLYVRLSDDSDPDTKSNGYIKYQPANTQWIYESDAPASYITSGEETTATVKFKNASDTTNNVHIATYKIETNNPDTPIFTLYLKFETE